MQVPMSIEYAIHGLVYLAGANPGKATLLSDIAGAIKIPESYLRKVFQLLSRNGIVISQRGVNGGYVLAMDPSEITLKDVMDAVEGTHPLYNCISRGRGCSITDNCPIRGAFESATKKMYEILEATTIKDLFIQLSQRKNRVGWLAEVN